MLSLSDVASPSYRNVTKLTLLTEILDWCPEALLMIVQGYVGTETRGNFVRHWGKKGLYYDSEISPAGIADVLYNPAGIVVRGDFVFVTDQGNHRIQVFQKHTGSIITTIGSHGPGPMQLGAPHGIAIDGDTLFVSEAETHRVQAIDLKRSQHIALGGVGRLHYPKGICVSGNNLFVVDARHRVCVFDKVTLRFLRQWGEQGARDGQLSFPFDVAVVGDKVYVVDSGNNRIQVFQPDGTFLKTFKVGGGLGLNWPSAIAVVQGEMFVADKNNHRILVLQAETGEVLKYWGYKGSHFGRFQMPSALAFNEGELYITEHKNHRVQVVV
jgi:DNA-binding beta-propeller fold protein YncE